MPTQQLPESTPAARIAAIDQNYLLLKEMGLKSSLYDWLPVLILFASDFLMLCLASIASFYIKRITNPALDAQIYFPLWPALLPFHAAFLAARLYPVVAMNAVDELRRLTWCTTLVFIALAATNFLFKHGLIYSRQVFFIAWLLALVFLPVGRTMARALFAKWHWWGQSAFILGAGAAGELVVRNLQRQPSLGLRPIAVFDDDPAKRGSLCGVPVIGDVTLAPKLAQEIGVSYCIMAFPGVSAARQLELLEIYHQSFKHCIVIPHLFAFATLRVPSKDLGSILGLDVQQPLLMPVPRFLKRVGDIVFTVIGGTLILPLIALCVLLVKLDSPGPVFFGHRRIGRNGQHFKAWKFRSMYQDSKERFKDFVEYGNNTMGDHWNDLAFWNECLKTSKTARVEWDNSQKFKRDPRVTRIGQFLRRTSLDELPQIWNVLMGEMSLVGPRPIVDEEVEKYDKYFSLYLKVTPGITGLWQVSGRTDTTYKERVQLDTFYVRNWSLWLDIHILARTVRVVLLGQGAY